VGGGSVGGESVGGGSVGGGSVGGVLVGVLLGRRVVSTGMTHCVRGCASEKRHWDPDSPRLYN
jgi:hypothetical protein